MRWELVRPGVIRILRDNGNFLIEYHYDDRIVLNTSRGVTTTIDLHRIEAEARSLVAQGITSAAVTNQDN